MTFKENLMNWLTFKECEHPPVFLNFTMENVKHLEHLFVPICERPMSGTGYDVFGVHWSHAEPASHPTHGMGVLDDIEEWQDQVRIPNVDKLDWDPFKRQAEAIDRDNDIAIVTLYVGPFERASCLSSFEDCLCNVMTNPEEFSDLMSAIADYKCEIIDRACRYGAPDVINFHDDWGTAKSTFLAPDLWREVIAPHAKRIYAAAADRGVFLSQHSCGAIAPLIPDMVEMGLRCWEGQAECNDMEALEKEYDGRLRILHRPDMTKFTPEQQAEFDGIIGQASSKPVHNVPAYDEKPTFLYD